MTGHRPPGTATAPASPGHGAAGRSGTTSAGVAGRAALLRPVLAAQLHRVWTTPPVRDRYVEYLTVMHGLIRASVPLMRAAVRRCGELSDQDPVAGALADYLTRHIDEETGHEEWLCQDLAAAGRDPAEPLRRIPSPTVAGLVGAQYYWIAHHHPVLLLGYVWVLEGSPPTPEFVTGLRLRTGWPASAFRTLRRHGAADLEHRAELAAVLDRLPLTPGLRAGVERNALHTTGQLAVLFADLADCRLPGGGGAR